MKGTVYKAMLGQQLFRELYYIYEGDCLQSYVRPAILYEREV